MTTNNNEIFSDNSWYIDEELNQILYFLLSLFAYTQPKLSVLICAISHKS